MRYHNITKDDMLNGDGLRVVLWVAGCEHHCKDCQNPVTWDINGGIVFDENAKQEIFNELDRGVSIFNVQGGYTLEKRKMLMVIIDKREYSDLLEILEKIDKQAFVITTRVQSVYGQGFRLTYK